MIRKVSNLLILFICLSSLFPVNLSHAQDDLSISYVSDEGIDVDGNGLLDYIKVELDVSVPQSGIYIVETSNLRDPSNQTIPVKAYRRLALDQGEHRITINFDGRRIHSSERKPDSFEFISLIKVDYSDAKFINNIALVNNYNYSNFETPPEYKVGVEKEDWVSYNVTEFYNPSQAASNKTLESLYMVTGDIKGTVVYLELEFKYSDGSVETDKVDGYLEKGSFTFPFLIPADLESGDKFGHLNEITISNSFTKNILGQNRTIHSYEEHRVINRTNIEYIFNQEYHWDKELGIMIEAWFNTTSINKATGSETENNVLLELNGTNLIKEKTRLTLDQLETTGEAKIIAKLINSEDKGIADEEILLKTVTDEIGAYTTNSTGQVEIDLDKNIETVIAEYPGSTRYSPAEAELELVTEQKDNSLLLVTAGLIIILAVIITVLLRQHSII